jgi:hypothetical protein
MATRNKVVKRILFAVTIAMAITGALLLRGSRSEFADLYSLGPAVGVYPASAGTTRIGSRSYIALPERTPAPSGSGGGYARYFVYIGSGSLTGVAHMPTVLVFKPRQEEALRARIGARHWAKEPGIVTSQGDLDTYEGGKSAIYLITKGWAQGVARDAGLPFEEGGAVVMLSEKPDWITMRLWQLRRFLHVD